MGDYERLAGERGEVAKFMRRLYAKNLTTCSGGNISLRCGEDLLLVTPSGLDKGELSDGEICLLNLAGENLQPRLKPTMEAGMHLEILRRRPEMRAVLHAHPVFATAFSCLEAGPDTALCGESFLLASRLARAGFAAPGGPELARLAAEALASSDVALLENHGVVAIGSTLLKAFDLLEVVEASAKMNFIVHCMGGGRPLGPEARRSMSQAFSLELS